MGGIHLSNTKYQKLINKLTIKNDSCDHRDNYPADGEGLRQA